MLEKLYKEANILRGQWTCLYLKNYSTNEDYKREKELEKQIDELVEQIRALGGEYNW